MLAIAGLTRNGAKLHLYAAKVSECDFAEGTGRSSLRHDLRALLYCKPAQQSGAIV
jgi:hypothetical protein